jgi:enoyl-CoA hydratase
MPIDLQVESAIATITINQPERLNALDIAGLEELLARIEDVSARNDVRVVVLTGAGERAFVAGADIRAMAAFDAEQGARFGRLGHAVTRAIELAPQPVIAAVNGFALGGGCELALACDLRHASVNAVFAQPEVSLGIPPGWGGSQRLARAIGPGMAAELIFSGRRVKADEALRIGLVNAVHPAAELLPNVMDLATTIAANSPAKVRESKRLMALVAGDVEPGLAAEEQAFVASFPTADQREGMNAFLEKRTALFADVE